MEDKLKRITKPVIKNKLLVDKEEIEREDKIKQILSLRRENENLKKENKCITEKNNILNKKIKEYQEEREVYKEAFLKPLGDTEENPDVEMNEKETIKINENSLLESKIKELKNKNSELKSQLKEEKLKYDAEIHLIEELNISMKQDKIANKRLKDDIYKDRAVYESKINRLEEEIRTMKQQLEQLRTENEMIQEEKEDKYKAYFEDEYRKFNEQIANEKNKYDKLKEDYYEMETIKEIEHHNIKMKLENEKVILFIYSNL